MESCGLDWWAPHISKYTSLMAACISWFVMHRRRIPPNDSRTNMPLRKRIKWTTIQPSEGSRGVFHAQENSRRGFASLQQFCGYFETTDLADSVLGNVSGRGVSCLLPFTTMLRVLLLGQRGKLLIRLKHLLLRLWLARCGFFSPPQMVWAIFLLHYSNGLALPSLHCTSHVAVYLPAGSRCRLSR